MVGTASSFGRVIASFIALLALVGATLLANVSNEALAGGSPPPPGAIGVKVTNADGHPVGGAIVELRYKNRVVRHEMTNRDGLAGFRSVIPAEYGIRAGKRDVGVAHAIVKVESGKIARVPLVLKKPSTGNSVNSGDNSSTMTVK